MMNVWAGMGNIVEDPILNRTNGGAPVANFCIAVERDERKQDGEKITDFIDIEAYNNLAEFVAANFKKGELIGIRGRLERRTWTRKDGGKGCKLAVMANNAYFCGKKDAK